jgi:hypothetical protein
MGKNSGSRSGIRDEQPSALIYENILVLIRVADPDPNADPDSIGSVDPDTDSESGSGSRRAKMTPKSRQKFKKF